MPISKTLIFNNNKLMRIFVLPHPSYPDDFSLTLLRRYVFLNVKLHPWVCGAGQGEGQRQSLSWIRDFPENSILKSDVSSKLK